MANWEELKDKIRAANDGSPQRTYHALAGLEATRQGLVELAKYGHNFDLVEADATVPIEYPKMLYGPNDTVKVVESVEEEKELGSSWSTRPPGWIELETVPSVPSEPSKPVTVDIAAAVAAGTAS